MIDTNVFRIRLTSLLKEPVESKTRTYHERTRGERTAGRRGTA